MSEKLPENTPSQAITSSSPPPPPSSGSSHWVVIAIGKIGAYGLVWPIARDLPLLIKEDGWTAFLSALLILAVAAPTVLKDAATLVQARMGNK